MNKISSFIKSFINTNSGKERILYKIIDNKEADSFILQCMNSKSIFEATLLEICCKSDLLAGLHPLQACFIGIESTKHHKNIKKHSIEMDKDSKAGELLFTQHDRDGNIYFVDQTTGSQHVIKATDIIFNDLLLSKFNPIHAFYIGLTAGKKIHSHVGKVISIQQGQLNHRLKPIVKSHEN